MGFDVVYEPPRVTDLGTIEELIRERDELKKRVDELQAANTRLLEERRGIDERYMVEYFHRVCDVPVLPEPRVPTDERVRLRANLVTEEYVEFLAGIFDTSVLLNDLRSQLDKFTAEAPISVDMVDFADACADIKYVIVGSELEFGIDGRPVFRGVHEANLKKAGGPVREDGKRLKGPNWKPFDVAEELRRQGWRA